MRRITLAIRAGHTGESLLVSPLYHIYRRSYWVRCDGHVADLYTHEPLKPVCLDFACVVGHGHRSRFLLQSRSLDEHVVQFVPEYSRAHVNLGRGRLRVNLFYNITYHIAGSVNAVSDWEEERRQVGATQAPLTCKRRLERLQKTMVG